MRPTECIWCGLELLDDTTHDTIFACGSVQHPRSDCWSQSTGCEEIMRSRERIKRAIEVLETLRAIQRHEVTPYNSKLVSWERTSDGPWILHREVETVVDDLVRILEGET